MSRPGRAEQVADARLKLPMRVARLVRALLTPDRKIVQADAAEYLEN